MSGPSSLSNRSSCFTKKAKGSSAFEIGSSDGTFHTTVEDCYCQIYYEVLDFVVEAIGDRFDQPGYHVYQKLKELVLKSEAYQNELEAVLVVYKDDLSKVELEAQLLLLKSLCKDVCKELQDNFSVHDAV